MTDAGVINQFLEVFGRYIDSGFGVVRGDVASLAQILVALDVALAALFWAWNTGEDLLARLVKKTLYVGAFAFLILDFQRLAQIVFDSFAGLGLKAGGSALAAADLLRPGRIAATGVEAIRPLLEAAGELAGFPAIFENFVQVVILLAAVLVVLVAFFILAVQLFVTLLEFKLTTLAGFVLVPFGLFGRTAFLAERVLGAVMAAGVKVLVLAVIVGIGSTLFDGFVVDFAGEQPTLDQVLAVAVAALSLLGLGIFGPGIATGLVSGAPQLGAGAAVGAALTTAGLATAAAGAARGAIGGAAGVVRGARTLAAQAPGATSDSGGGGGGQRGGPTLPAPPAPEPPPRPDTPHLASPPSPKDMGPEGGPAPTRGPGTAPGDATREPAESSEPPSPSQGGQAPAPGAGDSTPAWARRLRRDQAVSGGLSLATHAIRSGDSAGGGASVPLNEEKP